MIWQLVRSNGSSLAIPFVKNDPYGITFFSSAKNVMTTKLTYKLKGIPTKPLHLPFSCTQYQPRSYYGSFFMNVFPVHPWGGFLVTGKGLK